MTTQPSSLTLSQGAAALGIDVETLTAALNDAVLLAETPTASQCTMPGPALQVRFEAAGCLVGASRESGASAAPWCIALPVPRSEPSGYSLQHFFSTLIP
ncbi:MAG TPA: hypothetical protein QGF05_09470 [Dehalococcoidia bacterium]|nr:hypothetical protein [Dehalococcoidia bacterium]